MTDMTPEKAQAMLEHWSTGRVHQHSYMKVEVAPDIARAYIAQAAEIRAKDARIAELEAQVAALSPPPDFGEGAVIGYTMASADVAALKRQLAEARNAALIPLADHKMAVAGALSKAAALSWSETDLRSRPWLCYACPVSKAVAKDVAREIAAAILSLADQDALAEVQALRSDRDQGYHADRRAEAAEAEVARLREALADAAGALDSAGEELSDFANILSREPWQANHAYESAVQARAALSQEKTHD